MGRLENQQRVANTDDMSPSVAQNGLAIVVSKITPQTSTNTGNWFSQLIDSPTFQNEQTHKIKLRPPSIRLTRITNSRGWIGAHVSHKLSLKLKRVLSDFRETIF